MSSAANLVNRKRKQDEITCVDPDNQSKKQCVGSEDKLNFALLSYVIEQWGGKYTYGFLGVSKLARIKAEVHFSYEQQLKQLTELQSQIQSLQSKIQKTKSIQSLYNLKEEKQHLEKYVKELKDEQQIKTRLEQLDTIELFLSEEHKIITSFIELVVRNPKIIEDSDLSIYLISPEKITLSTLAEIKTKIPSCEIESIKPKENEWDFLDEINNTFSYEKSKSHLSPSELYHQQKVSLVQVLEKWCELQSKKEYIVYLCIYLGIFNKERTKVQTVNRKYCSEHKIPYYQFSESRVACVICGKTEVDIDSNKTYPKEQKNSDYERLKYWIDKLDEFDEVPRPASEQEIVDDIMSEIWLEKGRADHDLSVADARKHLEETDNKKYKRLAPSLSSKINGKVRPIMTADEKFNFISLFLEFQEPFERLKGLLRSSFPSYDLFLRFESYLLGYRRFIPFTNIMKTDDKKEIQIMLMMIMAEDRKMKLPPDAQF